MMAIFSKAVPHEAELKKIMSIFLAGLIILNIRAGQNRRGVHAKPISATPQS